jgi:hypothetical protein
LRSKTKANTNNFVLASGLNSGAMFLKLQKQASWCSTYFDLSK